MRSYRNPVRARWPAESNFRFPCYRTPGISETHALSLQLAEEAARLHRSIHHAQRVVTTEAGRRLVAAGHGVAVLPDGLVRPFEAVMGIRGVPLAEEWAHRRHRLLFREEAGLSGPARRLLDHLRRPRTGG